MARLLLEQLWEAIDLAGNGVSSSAEQHFSKAAANR
jgi:hypothetical protein